MGKGSEQATHRRGKLKRLTMYKEMLKVICNQRNRNLNDEVSTGNY